MITLTSVTIQRGTKLLLDQASATIFANQKVGLIGLNGCGKSSLFLLMLKKISPDNGDIYIQSDIRIAYLEQEISNSTLPALKYAMNGNQNFAEIMQHLKQAQKDADNYKIAELHNKLYSIGGYALEAQAIKILIGLGFNQDDIQKPVNQFSGGWRMRLNLAQVLMSSADLLLLDEPTNYLDMDATIWLENWLQNYMGTLLLISHDRDFLDNVTKKIIHIDNKKLVSYSGNYSSFERQQSEQLTQQENIHDKQQKKIEHLNKYINRFRAKATKARQAQSRIKLLQKMELITINQKQSPFTFKFLDTPICNGPLINFSDISISYGSDAILKNINFSLNPQDTIGILGINGAGKSTFIKTLAGILKPNNGIITTNKNLKIGYFAQHQIDQLEMHNSPLEHLRKLNNNTTEQQMRTFLGGFGFNNDMVFQQITHFSGGEKARLVLALLIWQKPNLLLLDEPTNHLDLEMRKSLNYALQDYTGTVILVTHDRHLLKTTVNELYLIHNQTITKFNGDLKDYQDWSLKSRNQKIHTIDLKPKKNCNKQLLKKLTSLEKKISLLLNQKKQLDQFLLKPELYLPENKAELDQYLQNSTTVTNKIKTLEIEWFELQNK